MMGKKINKYHALDIGCGLGRLSLRIARIGINVTSIDISAAFISNIISQAKIENLPITGICGDALKTVHEKNYDIIIISFFTHLLFEDERVILYKKARDLTRKNGINIISGFSDKKIMFNVEKSYKKNGWQIIERYESVVSAVSGQKFNAFSFIINNKNIRDNKDDIELVLFAKKIALSSIGIEV